MKEVNTAEKRDKQMSNLGKKEKKIIKLGMEDIDNGICANATSLYIILTISKWLEENQQEMLGNSLKTILKLKVGPTLRNKDGDGLFRTPARDTLLHILFDEIVPPILPSPSLQ